MSIKQNQNRRSTWKGVLTIVFCGILVVGLSDRVNSEVTTRQTDRNSPVDRKTRIAFARISLKNAILNRDRLSVLNTQGAISQVQFLNALDQVNSARNALTAAICDLPISPKISALQATISYLIHDRNRYQLLANEGAISRREAELKQEKVILAQEDLNTALRNEPTSQRNIIKINQCREQELKNTKLGESEP